MSNLGVAVVRQYQRGVVFRLGKLRKVREPIALQLRNLQILGDIAAEKNSTIIFPAQFMESVRAITQFTEQEASAAAVAGASESKTASE